MGREVLQPHGTGMALVFLSEHLKKSPKPQVFRASPA